MTVTLQEASGQVQRGRPGTPPEATFQEACLWTTSMCTVLGLSYITIFHLHYSRVTGILCLLPPLLHLFFFNSYRNRPRDMDQWFSSWCPGSPKEMVESLELRPGSGLGANIGALASRTLPIPCVFLYYLDFRA